MFTTKPGLFGLFDGWANPTGVALICTLTTMVICSQPFIRRSGHFEVRYLPHPQLSTSTQACGKYPQIFYFTHLLYVGYFVLLALHAPLPWLWMLTPGTVFLCELMFRVFSWFTDSRGKSVITSGIVLPSNVTGLIIKRPHNFNFSPGDWVFIKASKFPNKYI